MNRPPRLVVATVLLAALAAGCATPGTERARTARVGLQAAHERLESARSATRDAQLGLDALLSIEAGDLNPAYETFEESMRTLQHQAEAVAKLPTELRSRGDAYFDQWEQDLTRIQDPALRAASASRRGEALAEYNRVVGTMWSSQTVFQGLLSLLRDVHLVLGNDLTPAGLDSVRDTSGRVSDEVQHVSARLLALMKEVESVSDSLAPSIPPP